MFNALEWEIGAHDTIHIIMTKEECRPPNRDQKETVQLLEAVQWRLRRIDYYLDLAGVLQNSLSLQERSTLDGYCTALRELRESFRSEQNLYIQTLRKITPRPGETGKDTGEPSTRIIQQREFVLNLKHTEEDIESDLEQRLIRAGYDHDFAVAAACEPELLVFIDFERWRRKYRIPKDLPRVSPIEIEFLDEDPAF